MYNTRYPSHLLAAMEFKYNNYPFHFIVFMNVDWNRICMRA